MSNRIGVCLMVVGSLVAVGAMAVGLASNDTLTIWSAVAAEALGCGVLVVGLHLVTGGRR